MIISVLISIVFTLPSPAPAQPAAAQVAPAATVTPVKKAVKAKTQTAVPAAAPVAQAPTAQVPQETTPNLPTNNGFTLLIGCVVAKGSNNEVSADDILKNALEYLASVAGKGVAEIEHFALMQALDAYIPQIAEYLSNNGVCMVSFAPGKGTALARLIDGLRPYAKKVIAPLA